MTRSEVEFRRGARRLVGIAMGASVDGASYVSRLSVTGQPVISVSGGRIPRFWRNRSNIIAAPVPLCLHLGSGWHARFPLSAEVARLAENQKKKSLIQNKGLPRLFRFFLGKAIGRGSCHLFDGSG